MSKIFSKRSGFTLVEIIVAFAVFAIMAAMLVSLTGLAVRQRQSNNALSRNLTEQQKYLAEHERETAYNSADGNFEFNFSGAASVSLNYSVVVAADETSEGGISYFVADANYTAAPTPSTPGGGDGEGVDLALAEKVDSRLYGSSNFEYIRIRNCVEVTDPDLLADIGAPANSSVYTIDVYAIDNAAAVRKEDTRLARNYKMRFDSDVLDCGYYVTDGSGTPNKFISYKNAAFGSDGKVSGGGNNQFEILPCSSDTVRVSIPTNIIGKYFDNQSYSTSNCFPGVESKFYVVLKGDVDLTEASFGENYYTDVSDGVTRYFYKPVEAKVTTDDDSDTETLSFINVYGAFKKGDTVILEGEKEDGES